MGVQITSRNYYNQYRPELVDWLLGNVGDWQKLTLVARFAVEKKFSQSSPLLINSTELTTGDGTLWSDYGFDEGDTIIFQYRLTTYDQNGDIDVGPITLNGFRAINSMNGDSIVLSSVLSADYSMMPYNNGTVRLDEVIIWADKQPEGFKITYGHLENDDSDGANLSSFIDGSLTQLQAVNTNTLTGWQQMEMIGQQSGMSIKKGLWNYWGKVGSHYYQYAIQIEFMFHGFYESQSNFEDYIKPSFSFDAAALTDNFEIIGYPEWNNPNTRISSDKQATKRLGNTGWFGENFNGQDNDFAVTSVEYTDATTGQVLNALSHSSNTKIKVVIEGVQNLSNGLSKFGVGFIWTPQEESYYHNKLTPFHQNLMVNTAGGYTSGVFPLSIFPNTTTYFGFSNDIDIKMNIKNVHFYEQGGNVVFEAEYRPSNGFEDFIEGLDPRDNKYGLWVSVADRTLETNFSNRVNLLVDYRGFEKYIPPVGPWDPMTIDFFEHPEDGSVDSILCYQDFFVEDDILARVKFNLAVLHPLPFDVPKSIIFKIEAKNSLTGEVFELQSYKVDLTGFPVDIDGVPQWNYDSLRGFKLESGNNKNWVKVQRDDSTDQGLSKGYIAYFGFKIRWEDWLPRTGVPADFFNTNELNNGFNNDWLHYLETTDWDVNFVVNIIADLDGDEVRYVNEKKIEFKDYTSNENVNEAWEFTLESDQTVLNNGVDADGHPTAVLPENEIVRIAVTYTRLTGVWASIFEVYGTICAEFYQGAGQMQFRQLSSVWGSESDNPLGPVFGSQKLKVTLLSPTEMKLECLVDTSMVDSGVTKFTSRLGCYVQDPPQGEDVYWNDEVESEKILENETGNIYYDTDLVKNL